jgi:hypothetical protein
MPEILQPASVPPSGQPRENAVINPVRYLSSEGEVKVERLGSTISG